jgi:glycosyltransferase involved in cell wall biosynthesis
MKILQVISYFYPALTYGGPAKVAYDLSKELTKTNQVTVFTTDVWDETRRIKDAEKLKNTKSFEVRYYRNILNKTAFKLRLFTGFGMVLDYFRERDRYDVVHIHDVFILPHLFIGYVAIFFKKPFFYSPHGVLDPVRLKDKSMAKFLIYNILVKKVLKRAKTVICTSDEEKAVLEKLGFLNCTTVFNGVAEVAVEPSKKYSKYSRDDLLTFLYVGKIHPLKGLKELLIAMSQMDISCQLLIAGPDDGGKSDLIRVIEDKNLSNVHFLGYVNDEEKRELFDLADLFVHPSLSEGFSISILESLNNGVPVLITKACNFPDVEKYGAGMVLPNENLVTKIRKSLIAIYDNKSKLRMMGENGRKLIKGKYSIQAMAEKVERIYKNAI